jgi:hypothetical protein
MGEPREVDTTPSWLKDDTVIEVDVSRLEDYASHIKGELGVFEANMKQAVDKLGLYNAPFGGGGFAEGQSFRGINDRNKGAATQMAMDVRLGLMALYNAANAIAEEYGSGDALSKATNDSVFNAFSGMPGKKMLKDLAADGAAAGGGTKDENAPPGKDETKIDASTDSVSGEGDKDDNKDDSGVVIGEKDKPGSYEVGADNEQVKSAPLDYATQEEGRGKGE